MSTFLYEDLLVYLLCTRYAMKFESSDFDRHSVHSDYLFLSMMLTSSLRLYFRWIFCVLLVESLDLRTVVDVAMWVTLSYRGD